ncbi:MAG: asparaginase [Corynebacteriales bacterium]|nr:asparaginase [Mycobacteriales bacterium]
MTQAANTAHQTHPVIATLTRGNYVESWHRGSVYVATSDHHEVLTLGSTHSRMYPRSANKPLQAVGMLRAGAKLDNENLALSAGSHRGEAQHIDQVTALLESVGLSPNSLACPAALPANENARDAWVRSGRGAEPIAMGCSGKHAAMLATCVANAWPTSGYLSPVHPLQVALRDTVERLAGEPVGELTTDGCGAPIFPISLAGLARGFSRLVDAELGTDERAVADAMRLYPELVEGSDGDDSRMMAKVEGLLCKYGADGVQAAAIAGVGAVAFKVDDGGLRTNVPVLAAALAQLGVKVPAEFFTVDVLGGGAPVGSISASF